MKASIVKIGNSRGVRIPKPVFEQCGFDDEVDMIVRNDELVLRLPKNVREGWNESFQRMAANNDDTPLPKLDAVNTSWDNFQWEWK